MKFSKMIFFLEIQKVNVENQELCNFIVDQSIKKKIPLVATNENFFR